MPRNLRKLGLLAAALAACSQAVAQPSGQPAAQPAGPAAAPPRCVLLPFDYQGVALEPGLLLRQVDGVKAFYLALSNDDLLHGFRLRAKRPAPGKELGGWYSDDLFHVFGQIIAGLSRLHAATGDAACRDKVHYLLTQWAACIEPDGFFFYSRQPKSPHYTYDKMVGGLVDAHLYAHDPQALQYLQRITPWAVKNLTRDRPCPTVANGNADEWYTLSENLYRAYLASGNRTALYRDFGQVWEYGGYWSLYARGGNVGQNIFAETCAGQPRAYHAYSHVNTLSGAAAAYLLTGQPHYLDTLRNAYDFLQETQCFATGGYGPNEHFFPPPALEAVLGQTHASFETQCGSWAAFKLGKYLISFTGDARYGDWIERLVYNGLSASIPSGKDGRVFYYSDYNPGGGSKFLHDTPWTCCAGTRPCAVADYCDLIYFKSGPVAGGPGICVNLYTPSSVRFQAGGRAVILHQETAFPQTDLVTFSVQAEQPVDFVLKLRKPQWLTRPATGTVNNQSLELPEDKWHWMTVRRTWQTGDRLEIRLPMSPTVRRLPGGHARHYAVSVGPVVLAAAAEENPGRLLAAANLEQALLPVPTKPLSYRAAAAPAVVWKPYYQFAAGEKYFLYLTDSPAVPAAKPAPAAGPLAPPPTLRFVPGSTVKVEQLLGEIDKEFQRPTLSRTFSRCGVLGTDLGYSFEHQGHAYFLFGDTVGHVSWAEDTIALTDARDPEHGVRLDFLMDGQGKYLVIKPPGISMGPFEVPVGGISLAGQMYVLVRTDHKADWSQERSVLTKFMPPGKFQPLRTVSPPPAAHFLTMSLHHQPGPMPRLPPGGPYVFIWGTGKYRRSDAFLSIVPAAHFETGQGTRYFTGLDAAAVPTWSPRELDSKPIVTNGTLGDLSVTWCRDLGLWLMTYDRAVPTACVAFSYSRTPWGPWSEPQAIFNAVRDHALGRFIHNPRAQPPDGLAGPVIGKPQSQWEAEFGGFYAPYVVERFTKLVGSELQLYYCLSTWNPYVVVLMKSTLHVE